MRGVISFLKTTPILWSLFREQLVELRNTPVFFWNFCIIFYSSISYLYYVTFPATQRELQAYFFDVDVFSFLFLYFISVLFATLFVPFLGSRGVYIITTSAISTLWCVCASNLDYFFSKGGLKFFRLKSHSNALNIVDFEFAVIMDKTTFSFAFLTLTIGFCASIYSLTYFKNEPHSDRFILLLHWFILSMSLLVVADNAILMFLGWELIGLTSFMLINFWTLRRGTMKAAFKAFTFNKVSDIFILFFIVLMLQQTHTVNISVWLQLLLLDSLSYNDLFYPVLFLILGSSIKSAQLIGHLWLPDSMEAPIPASALIHSATLVSAGVYLLLRLQPFLFFTGLHHFVLILGAVTAFYGALVSSAQTDAKRLLAYSTISHCGFLFVTICLHSVDLTIAYLYLHGFFKALTFFCVGNIIKLSRGYQDTRTMGQYCHLLPVESVLFLICAVNLGGLPFTVGFFYKHLLQMFIISNNYFLVASVFCLLGMLAGIVYVFRLVYYVLFDIRKGTKISNHLVTNPALQHPNYTNTTLFSIIAILMFLGVGYLVYFEYLYNLPSTGAYPLLALSDNLPSWLVSTVFSLSFFIFFCTLFLPVSLILVLVECRWGVSSLYRKFFLILIVFIIPFFLISGVGTNLHRSILSNEL